MGDLTSRRDPTRPWAEFDRKPFAAAIPMAVAQLCPPGSRGFTVIGGLLSFKWGADADEPWPSRKALAARCNLSVWQVRCGIDDLVTAGLLRVLPRRDEHGQTSNTYELHPALGAMSKEERRAWGAQKAAVEETRTTTHEEATP